MQQSKAKLMLNTSNFFFFHAIFLRLLTNFMKWTNIREYPTSGNANHLSLDPPEFTTATQVGCNSPGIYPSIRFVNSIPLAAIWRQLQQRQSFRMLQKCKSPYKKRIWYPSSPPLKGSFISPFKWRSSFQSTSSSLKIECPLPLQAEYTLN